MSRSPSGKRARFFFGTEAEAEAFAEGRRGVQGPAQIVGWLQAIIAELRKLRLPAGHHGSALLAVLEALEAERRALRTRAKEMLQQTSGALPGWRLGGVVGNDGQEKVPGEFMTIRQHEREAGLRLIQRKEGR
jgi:hypothetical protein